MSRFGFWKSACAVILFGAVTAVVTPAQITQLYEFDAGEGEATEAGVIQGFDGYLYGTTDSEVFKLPPVQFAEDTILYFFCSQPNCGDGGNPFGGLIQGTDGNFYGTTTSGGNDGCDDGCGTVFAITPSGTFTSLHSFVGTDGSKPFAGLIQASDGTFYGTTYDGGANGGGTIFNITSTGTLTVLYSFCAQAKCADGSNPRAALLQGTNSNLYGTTSTGGTSNVGTVFKFTSAGKLTTLHSFSGADGANPYAGLIQASNGKFYGTTYAGGAYGLGAIFRITAAGKLTTLHSFVGTDGANPYGGLTQSIQGYFFGTTYGGGVTYKGTAAAGTIFEYFPSDGSVATEYGFCAFEDCADGAYPAAGLNEGTDGYLYGTTEGGGEGNGTVFGIGSGDRPFVETNPTSGTVEEAVTILGNDLTGTTKVTFGSKAATFTVVSDSEISTTVPVGATTGKVHVTTSGGKLLTKVPFRVIP